MTHDYRGCMLSSWDTKQGKQDTFYVILGFVIKKR